MIIRNVSCTAYLNRFNFIRLYSKDLKGVQVKLLEARAYDIHRK